MGQIWNLKVQQRAFADGLAVGVRQRGGVKGKCKVFGLNNWESLELIPEAVGSHRKILRLGGRGRGQVPQSPRRQPRLGWIRALAQPPARCGLLGTMKPFWTPISPFYKEAVRSKGPLETFAAQRLLLQDPLTQIARDQIYTHSLRSQTPLPHPPRRPPCPRGQDTEVPWSGSLEGNGDNDKRYLLSTHSVPRAVSAPSH